MSAFDNELQANARYAQTFTDPGLPGRAGTGLAVVTCMDSRIDPLAVLGLAPGQAKVLRSAGARVSDEVLTSLVLAHHLLGVERVMVMAHTECGMTSKTDEQVRAIVAERTGADVTGLQFGTIQDQEATLREDVRRVRCSPYLPDTMPVLGARYDVHTGRVEVLEPDGS